MAKLIFLLDGNVIKEYALDKERMTVGRRPSNDVYIDNLAISGEHAVLVTMGEDTYLEDLNSTNGTLVNNKQVKKQTLKHGDEIGLGKYKLKYLNDGVVNTAQPNGFSDTILVEPESTTVKEDDIPESIETPSNQALEASEDDSSKTEAAEQPSVVDEPQEPTVEEVPDVSVPHGTEGQGPHLQILSGEHAGSALLLDKTMVKVGQPGEQVAVVTKRQDGYFITHVTGDNHPLVNGKQIGAQAYALNNQDEVEVMGIKMAFHLD